MDTLAKLNPHPRDEHIEFDEPTPTLIQLMAIAIIRLLLHGIIAILNTLTPTKLLRK